jgi:hypothetical protein
VVLDMKDGTTRLVPKAKGPVGFTVDSKTIVSYATGAIAGEKQPLLLIAADNLERTRIDIPVKGGLTYFVSRAGNYVVAASSVAESPMALCDLDTREVTVLGQRKLGFSEFVSRDSRGELWLVFGGELFRLDLAAKKLEAITSGYQPLHINRLPNLDVLVFDHAKSNQLVFFDPDKMEAVGKVALPAPAKSK